MKKFFTCVAVAFLAALSVPSFAQLNVGAGYLNSNLTEKAGSLSESFAFNGFYVKADYNFALIGSYLGVAPGLRYSFASCNTDDFGADSNWNEHYLDIPVMFNTGYDFSGNFGVYAFAGPTFSFGLASNLNVAAGGMSTKLNMYDYFDEYTEVSNSYRRFDILLGIGAGVEFRDHYRVELSYDYGLLNRMAVDGSTTHRGLFKLGLAYAF